MLHLVEFDYLWSIVYFLTKQLDQKCHFEVKIRPNLVKFVNFSVYKFDFKFRVRDKFELDFEIRIRCLSSNFVPMRISFEIRPSLDQRSTNTESLK